MKGNYYALFMTEILGDALEEIVLASDKNEMLGALESQDRADHQQFLDSDLPPHHTKVKVPESPEADEILRLFYKGHNYCHAAHLPAEIRYKGILTESPPVASMFDLKAEYFSDTIEGIPNESDQLRLVGDSRDRQKCAIPLNMDYNDFWYVSEKEGFKGLTVPNDAEIMEYGTGEPLKGLLAACFIKCPWNKCPANNVISGIHEKLVEIQVNEKPVASGFDLDKGCYLLQNERGSYFWEPNEDGRFTFRIRVNVPNKYARFSSFVVW